VRTLADTVLAGVFTGDLAVALERAGSFCRVVSTGLAVVADDDPEEVRAHRTTHLAGDLVRTAAELETAAGRWREGSLH
jgi:hypothetical protein